MAEVELHGNMAQLPKLLLRAPCEVSVEGRGTGKSFDIGFKMDQIIRTMPRSVTSLTGKTYGQLLTRTLPSSLKLLNQMGQQKDVTYVIGKRPPAHFKDSYETLNKFDNVISFINGTRFAMISQSEVGSGRGANVDYEIADEALLLNQEQYNNEVSPTNRGNLEFFGKKSRRPIWLHHGFKFSTSMPLNKEGRWILEYGDYYKTERGIRLFDIWNRVVMQQVDLLKVVAEYKATHSADLVDEFRRQWNEIQRLKKQIAPFVSKQGVLFTLSNAFDNLEMLGFDYLLKNQKQLPLLIFMTEIMNMYYDKVEDCFYSIQERKHVYYTGYDSERMLGKAQDVGYNLEEGMFDSCIYDRDCDTNEPLELSFDWGSSICVMTVQQPRYWDFVNNCSSPVVCQTMINEFFTKPDGGDNMMIRDLIGKFAKYYEGHHCRRVIFYKDKYGDHRNPNVLNNRTYNEMAEEELEKHGWTVLLEEHAGMEPPQSDKHLLWNIILGEANDTVPRFRINGDKCKYALISMNNAKVKTVEGQLKKDKSSERPTSGVLPEEATHFSDAVDKLIWTKYASYLNGGGYDFFTNM
jgi:hypothetical protein